MHLIEIVRGSVVVRIVVRAVRFLTSPSVASPGTVDSSLVLHVFRGFGRSTPDEATTIIAQSRAVRLADGLFGHVAAPWRESATRRLLHRIANAHTVTPAAAVRATGWAVASAAITHLTLLGTTAVSDIGSLTGWTVAVALAIGAIVKPGAVIAAWTSSRLCGYAERLRRHGGSPNVLRLSAVSLPVPAACAAGAIVGTVYTLAPVPAWCAMLAIPVVAWASHGINGRERVWLLRIVIAGFAVRFVLLAGFFGATYPHSGPFPILLPDESVIQYRAMWFRSIALGIPLEPQAYVTALGGYAESGHLYLLAYIQLLLGPSPYGIRSVSVLLYMIGSVALYRTARRSLGGPAALGGLAVVVFLPSLLVWSVSALKEPAYLSLTAISISSAVGAFRADTISRRLAAATVCVAAILAVGTMRAGAHVMVGGGILLGLLTAAGIRRPRLLLASLVLLAAVGWFAVRVPRVQIEMWNAVRMMTVSHAGHVATPGWSYRLLDPELYSGPNVNQGQLTGPQIARYMIRAAASFILVPLPWQAMSRSAVAYLAEQVLWYVLVLLAAVGVLAGLRTDPRLVLALFGVILVSGAAVALTSGNIGTLVRHRAMVLMPVAWLGSYGAYVLLTYVAARRQIRPASIPELVQA